MTKVKGVVYRGKDKLGCFKYMSESTEYDHILFLFNGNMVSSMHEEAREGGGSAVVQPLTYMYEKQRPRSVSIPTGWSIASGGFTELDRYSKRAIRNAIERVKRILIEDSSLKLVVFSCDTDDHTKIGSNIFNVCDEAILFISKAIRQLCAFDRTDYKRTVPTHDELDAIDKELLIHAELYAKIARLTQENIRLKRERQDDDVRLQRPTKQSRIRSFM